MNQAKARIIIFVKFVPLVAKSTRTAVRRKFLNEWITHQQDCSFLNIIHQPTLPFSKKSGYVYPRKGRIRDSSKIMKQFAYINEVKRFAQLIAMMGWTLPSFAQFTSPHGQVNIAGDFNGWDSGTANMTLIANNTWQGDLIITNQKFEFKFTTSGFANNWGISGQPHSTLPMAQMAGSGAGNILVTNPPILTLSGTNTVIITNSSIRFVFNDSTREYAVFLLNNLEATNLLYNASFETQAPGFSTRALYWYEGAPNNHGSMSGNARRFLFATGNNIINMRGLGGGFNATASSLWQEAPAQPGVTYEASALFTFDDPTNTWTNATLQLVLEFWAFNRSTNDSPLASYTLNLTGLSTNWSQRAIIGEAPSSAGWARLVVRANNYGSNGYVRVDNAVLRSTVVARNQNFNDWNTPASDGTYSRSGWLISTGRTVGSYIYDGITIPLARSGLAASLANSSSSNSGGFVTSPRFEDGVGDISLFYRHGYSGDPNQQPSEPLQLQVEISELGQFWTTAAFITGITNTSYQRVDIPANLTRGYVRITHAGGSTNRLLIDDVAVNLPVDESRFMNFNNWTNGSSTYGNWSMTNGVVSITAAYEGWSGQISGHVNNQNALYSPVFDDGIYSGYGSISFNYAAAGIDSPRTAGWALEARAHPGTNWSELARITNINSTSWRSYEEFFVHSAPHQLRIRNLAELSTSTNITPNYTEGFSGGIAPAGWELSAGYSTYNGSGDSGTNSGAPALKFDSDGAYAITRGLANPTNVRFMVKGMSITNINSFLVESITFTGTSWQTMLTLSNIPNSRLYTNIAVSTNTARLRFTYFKPGAGNLAFDDLLVQAPPYADTNTPQRLLLDNVNIGIPKESRFQDFDTWPLKPDLFSGAAFHQGWRLAGPTRIQTNKSFSGQAAMLSRTTAGSSSGNDYVADFEAVSKTSYTSGNVTMNGISWNMTDALVGTDAADWKNGSKSARMRGYGTSIMAMQQDWSNGVGTIAFNYQRYGTDAQTNYVVEISTNGAVNWFSVGLPFTPGASVQTFNHTANITGNVRMRIRQASGTGTSNRRANIDDITLTSFSNSGSSTTNSQLTSHFLTEGIGPVSFNYRHNLDITPPPASVLRAAVLTSSNGINWETHDTITITNTTYASYAKYLRLTNHYYVRIAITNGIGDALFDNVHVQRPQPPANATIIGRHTPERPYTNDTVRLYSDVTPLYGANNFSLTSYYRIGTAGTFNAIGMKSLGGNQFEALTDIPAQPSGTIVQYYMAAWYDGPGAESTRPAYYPLGAPTNLASYGIPRNAPGSVWINELDYSAWDTSVEPYLSAEFIELAGFAGTDLSGWQIQFVETDPGIHTITNFTISDQTNGFGFFVFGGDSILSPPKNADLNYLIMAMNQGVQLINELGFVEDSIAYGSVIDGFTKLPVEDLDFTSINDSISYLGVGASARNFVWSSNMTGRTLGAPNEGQVFSLPAIIAVSPAQLTYEYIRESLNPPVQTFMVSNAGVYQLDYTLTPNRPWITILTNGNFVLPAGQTRTHTVQIETTGLTDNLNGNVTITGDAQNNPASVSISLNEIALGTALASYSFDNTFIQTNGLVTILNGGTLGIDAHLVMTNGSLLSEEGEGVSESLGDFAYISGAQGAAAISSNAVDGLNNLPQFTLTGWLYPTSSTGSRIIIGNRTHNAGFEVELSGPSNRTLSLRIGTNSIAFNNVPIKTNTWNFYAIGFNGLTTATNQAVTLHVGTKFDRAYQLAVTSRFNSASSGISTNMLSIGSQPRGTNTFLGWLDDIRIFNGLLDDVNIEAVRREGAISFTGSGSVPRIDQHPSSIFLTSLGRQEQFTVIAFGTPLPQYQWRKSGTNQTGQTFKERIFPAASISDAGFYDVVVFNAFGAVTSQLAELVVVTNLPYTIELYQGDTARFSVGITPGQSTFQWQRNGANIPGSTSATLTIPNFTNRVSPSYRVAISNRNNIFYSDPVYANIIDLFFDATNGAQGVAKPSSATNVVLSWPSISNRYYDILWSTNLMAGQTNFVVIATNRFSTPPVNVWTDTVHGAKGNGFYRIRAKEAP